MEEKTWKRNHGPGIMEQESWRRDLRGDIIWGESWRRNRGGGIRDEEHSGGILEEEAP